MVLRVPRGSRGLTVGRRRGGATPPGRFVVDDEESILDAVTSALRYEGFDVRGATSGCDALASIADHAPDLIVLDWMLPDRSGIDLERDLRERGFRMPILFLSA